MHFRTCRVRDFHQRCSSIYVYLCFLQDFDLCVQCYEKDGHPHKMEKLGLDLDDGSSPSDQKQANPQVCIIQSL